MAGQRSDGKSDDKKPAAKTSNGNQDTVLTSIFAKLDSLTKETNDRAANTDSILQSISDKVDNFSTTVSNIKEELGQLKSEVIKEKRETRRHDARLSDLEKKLEFAERDSRKSSIVLDGVEEGKEKSLITILENLLGDLQVSFGTSECDKIFRRGKKWAPGRDSRQHLGRS